MKPLLSLIPFYALAFLTVFPAISQAQVHGDPAKTVTIFVGGFNPDGAATTGPFGVDYQDSLMDVMADMMGATSMADSGWQTASDLITIAEYYGDLAPAYYTAQDHSDLAAVTAQFGGGVPVYALIQAKFIKHVLERSGAEHVNLLGASFGGLVSRYMVCNDVEGLVSSGRIIRWETYEGANNGTWLANNGFAQWLFDTFAAPTIDTDHMLYSWVETYIEAPHNRMQSPLYGDLLVGHTSSVDDSANSAWLTTMLSLGGGWQVNDGVLTEADGVFVGASQAAKWRDRMPTRTWQPVDHYGLADYTGLRPVMVAQLTGKRRYTVKVVGVKMHHFDEGGGLFNPQMPAEVALDLRVWSPEAYRLWGISDALSDRSTNNFASPLFDVYGRNVWVDVDITMFDEMILEGETSLNIEIGAHEYDFEEHYEVWELFGSNDHLGTVSGNLPIMDGRVTVPGADFDLRLEMRIQEYPFERTIWLDGGEKVATRELPLSGQEQIIQVDFGPSFAGKAFRIFGGMSGLQPGHDLGNGVVLPVHQDAYSNYLANTLNTSLHQNFEGHLDVRGRATAVLNAGGPPLDPRAKDKDLVYAVAAFDGAGVPLAGSDAVVVEVR
ncbi:MAG: hypothetical protein HN405_07570 [Planctomycetes bacterium]|jgi:hypothetical protein|nr:hypothetical protein [Planctomycetota bacterium]MBT4028404.1 hypothetical protein [Planctomycetota bacterium]MBT4559725.1 hypothetical protein [Planctomycetota bacterium]MBT5102236.1 hypothetical protein [Planctomycetota bacterium]MBT7319457.1 hypothetical protein [Planctomycetota bacterium]